MALTQRVAQRRGYGAWFALVLAQAMWVQAAQTPWQTEVEELWPAAGHRQLPGAGWGVVAGAEPCFGVWWRFWVPSWQTPAVLWSLSCLGWGGRGVAGESSWKRSEPSIIKILIMRQVVAAVGRGRRWQRGSSAPVLGRRGAAWGHSSCKVPVTPGLALRDPSSSTSLSLGRKMGSALGKARCGWVPAPVGAALPSQEPLKPTWGALVWYQPRLGRGGLGGTWAKGEVSVGLVVSLV